VRKKYRGDASTYIERAMLTLPEQEDNSNGLQEKKTPWSESVSELYRPRDR
jgi:hypothetical protein